MKPEIEALLSGYSAGILTDGERQQLFRAALEDQEVYEALAAEQSLRELLAQPGVRRELLDALDRPGWAERLARWFPGPGPTLASVAAVLLVALGGFYLLRQAPPEPIPQPTTAPWSPSGKPQWPGMAPIDRQGQRLERGELLRRLMSLPLQQPFAVELSLDRGGPSPVYAIGETMRAAFRVDRESHVLIVEARPDGAVIEIFPASPSVLSRVPAGVAQTVPPASFPPLPVTGPEGRRRVRLVALPARVDLDQLTDSQLRLLEPARAVAEISYDVVRASP